MSWKITNKKIVFTISLALLLLVANSWLTLRHPFFIGFISERPLGVYQFRLVSYEVTDYGSRGSVAVDEDFGNLYTAVSVVLGKDFVYRAGSYQYPFKRDSAGTLIFFAYLLSLVVNILCVVYLPVSCVKSL